MVADAIRPIGQRRSYARSLAWLPIRHKENGLMSARNLIGERSPRPLAAAFVALTFATLIACGASSAQQARTGGGPTPSPEGAEVRFVGLADGARLPTKATIRFGLRGMGVAPAGLERDNSGHHHLLIDTALPPLDKPIPNDFNHLHF